MTEERHSELAIHHLHPADGEELVKRGLFGGATDLFSLRD